MGDVFGRHEGHLALVQFDPDGPRGEPVEHVHGSPEGLGGRIVPVALVDLFRDGRRGLVEGAPRAAVENELQQELVALADERHGRRFVDPPALDAHEPVLHRVDADPDAVSAADPVGRFDGRKRRDRIFVYPDRYALFESDGKKLGRIGRLPGMDAHAGRDETCRGFERLQTAGFVGQPEDIGIRGIGFLVGSLYRQLPGFAEVDHFLPAGKIVQEGLVAPGSVDLHRRVDHVGDELKSHLVVPAAGRAVGQDIDAALFKLGQQGPHRDVPGDAGRVPVVPLVHGLALDDLDAGPGELFLRVHDHGFLRAAPHHAFRHVVDAFFIRLAEIGRYADHVDVVIGEPARDRTTVQAAGYRRPDRPALQTAQIHDVRLP